MSNLNPQQFAESLHDVPVTPHARLGTEAAYVRHVPTHLLHDAYSGEYDAPAHQMESARAEHLQRYGASHPGDAPGAQEALEADVAKHGVRQPLVLNYHPPHEPGRDGEWGISDGSHRLLAAMRTNQSHVPVVQRF